MQLRPKRPQVEAFLAVSMDGFIAGSDHDLSWLEPFSHDSAEDTGYAALMARVDALVLGRRTYDAVAAFSEWPYVGKAVVVLTHRPLTPQHGERCVQGHLPTVLEGLAREGVRSVYLDGGQAVRQGLQAKVIDRLTISWVPVLLGQGVSLLNGCPGPLGFAVQSARLLPSGLVQTVYQPLA
jgi:dihydrofolate reductase